jgi:hypothetical protein
MPRSTGISAKLEADLEALYGPLPRINPEDLQPARSSPCEGCRNSGRCGPGPLACAAFELHVNTEAATHP